MVTFTRIEPEPDLFYVPISLKLTPNLNHIGPEKDCNPETQWSKGSAYHVWEAKGWPDEKGDRVVYSLWVRDWHRPLV